MKCAYPDYLKEKERKREKEEELFDVVFDDGRVLLRSMAVASVVLVVSSALVAI